MTAVTSKIDWNEIANLIEEGEPLSLALTSEELEDLRQHLLEHPRRIVLLLELDLEEVHVEWLAQLNEYRDALILAPRSHGKSWVCGIA